MTAERYPLNPPPLRKPPAFARGLLRRTPSGARLPNNDYLRKEMHRRASIPDGLGLPEHQVPVSATVSLTGKPGHKAEVRDNETDRADRGWPLQPDMVSA